MNFHLGAPPGVYGLVSQIDILLKDMHWTCVIAYAFPARNHMLLAFLLGLVKMYQTCYHPDWVLIPDGAQDPVNFDVVLGIADQMHGLTLEQEVVQGATAHTEEAIPNGIPNVQAMENGGMHPGAQFIAAIGEETVGDHEESYPSGLVDGSFSQETLPLKT
ncbi:hypothetical protein DCAR_0520811 [Daucus carota subsp. sativus]|uniref:Uncharacterized protein n=1 Tax=Daucus carota subsp. sativus TaxID=79200 RepID=A0A162A403_DAUCS|nr:hypothetical protein DCAR_0520811 [Daucus carota subsp. sativus]